MSETERPLILCIDDAVDILDVVERLLGDAGYDVTVAHDGAQALAAIDGIKPDLLLLDIKMPGMDGYEVCRAIQENPRTAYIPVIFVTAMHEEQDRARAFAVGAVDFLVKPLDKKTLLEKVATHLHTTSRWNRLHSARVAWHEQIQPGEFLRFKEFITNELNLTPEQQYSFSKVAPAELYTAAQAINVTSRRMGQYVAQHLGLPYVHDINPDEAELGMLPRAFCIANKFVPVRSPDGRRTYVISNPFDGDMIDAVRRFTDIPAEGSIAIADPKTINLVFSNDPSRPTEPARANEPARVTRGDGAPSVAGNAPADMPDKPQDLVRAVEALGERIIAMGNNILEVAVTERASDIHIEPKERNTVVRFRVDGELREYFSVSKDTGVKLVSRLKVLAALDISEKRLPQDGAFVGTIDNRIFNFRVATTSTPHGESIVMRLLEPYSKPKEIQELGFSDRQTAVLAEVAKQPEGIIVVAGVTGSGKTTTIHTLLHRADTATRCVMTIEDPVEYRLPFARQQQVNEKADLTYERLLKSVVRQDPDILFVGEIRDKLSAQMSFDFASTGRLTITSMHTVNTTTAIFRLERLGIARGVMADAVIAIIAQKLIKTLCPHCKKTVPISDEEHALLAPFTDRVPAQVGRAVGCQRCRNTGYWGRQVVGEVLRFDARITELVRSGKSVSDIRRFIQDRGDYTITDHALDKVRSLAMTPLDVYRRVLLDERRYAPETVGAAQTGMSAKGVSLPGRPLVLVINDASNIGATISSALEGIVCDVTSADSVGAAICYLVTASFALVIASVSDAVADSEALLKAMVEKENATPVLFITPSGEGSADLAELAPGPLHFLPRSARPAAIADVVAGIIATP